VEKADKKFLLLLMYCTGTTHTVKSTNSTH